MCISDQDDELHFVQQAEGTSCVQHLLIRTSELEMRIQKLLLNSTSPAFYDVLGVSAHLTQRSIFDVDAIVQEAKVDSRLFQQPSRTYGAG